MKKDLAIEVNGVSKKFSKKVKDALRYGLVDISKGALGMDNNSKSLRAGEFWAVENISFDVKKGETLGIIGPNGSGKTTLLKLLNGIYTPDKGRIDLRGRVGALIAVGAGFHPMLTGRENIYVNGTILGMSRAEISRKFNEIVEFADIGEFLDAPVRTYSSGMHVRLGFAIAVHSETEILLVDEVLSVGDMEYALKCSRKINEIRDRGTSVVFVSHNNQAIKNICDRTIWISGGEIIKEGETNKVVNAYSNRTIKSGNRRYAISKKLNYDPTVSLGVKIADKKLVKKNSFIIGEKLIIRIKYTTERELKEPIFGVTIFTQKGIRLLSSYSEQGKYGTLKKGDGYIDFVLGQVNFRQGKYVVTVSVSEKSIPNILEIHNKFYTFKVLGDKDVHEGLIYIDEAWRQGVSQLSDG